MCHRTASTMTACVAPSYCSTSPQSISTHLPNQPDHRSFHFSSLTISLRLNPKVYNLPASPFRVKKALRDDLFIFVLVKLLLLLSALHPTAYPFSPSISATQHPHILVTRQAVPSPSVAWSSSCFWALSTCLIFCSRASLLKYSMSLTDLGPNIFTGTTECTLQKILLLPLLCYCHTLTVVTLYFLPHDVLQSISPSWRKADSASRS